MFLGPLVVQRVAVHESDACARPARGRWRAREGISNARGHLVMAVRDGEQKHSSRLARVQRAEHMRSLSGLRPHHNQHGGMIKMADATAKLESAGAHTDLVRMVCTAGLIVPGLCAKGRDAFI